MMETACRQGRENFHLAIPPEAVSDVVKIINNDFGKDNVKNNA